MADLITFKPLVPRDTVIVSPSEVEGNPFLLEVPITSNHYVRKRFINDWTVRTWYENKSAKCSFFVTLTFNDNNVPRFSDGRLGFRKDLCVKFMKRLRNWLRREYGLEEDVFKYFLCSEYGKNTHRPHHHVLFFFKEFLAFPVFCELVHRAWTYGFCDVEIPESNKVLTYVSKYVAKDMYSMDVATSSTDESINEDFRIYNFGTHKYDEWTVTRYNFHLQSMGYGSALLDDLTEKDLSEGVKFVFMGTIARPFAIPKYAADRLLRERKFFRDEITGKKRSRTYTNPLGKRVHEARVKNRVNQVVSDIQKYQLPENQRYVLDFYGIDIDTDLLNIKNILAKNDHRVFDDFETDLFDYLLNKRFRPKHEYFGVTSKEDKRKAVLWNEDYQGYEELFTYLKDMQFIMDCRQQRADEVKEYNNLIKKRRYGRSY